MTIRLIQAIIKRALKHLRLDDTRFSVDRPITSYYKVQRMIATCVRGKPFLINKSVIKRKQFLDIGCGPNVHGNFINLDYAWHPGLDLCWDITKGIPLESNSVHGIFTEHCLEHINFAFIELILAECFRILQPGSILRIVVPDGELYLRGYVNLLESDKAPPLPYAHRDSENGAYSPIISVNRIFREEGHQFIYDFDCLKELLLKAGFNQIHKLGFGHGRNSNLILDSPSRKFESLYIEAVKL